MFKALFKTRFLSMFSGIFSGRRGGKRRSPLVLVGISLLSVYILAAFAFMFGGLFSQLAQPFHAGGIDWFYFAFAIMLATVMMLVGSLFSTYAQLYNARDNEMLLSMPIPPSAILASRMLSLYLLDLLFGAAVLLPAGAVWGVMIGMSAASVVLFALTVIILPLFTLSLSCALGALIAVISSRIRAKSAVTMILSLGFLAVYFVFIGRINNYIAALIENGGELARSAAAILPLRWLSEGAARGDALHFAFAVIFIALLFGAVYVLLSVFFISIVTRRTGFAKRRYVAREAKASSVGRALFRRELMRFTASPVYMMNGGLGAIFIAILPIAALIRRDMLVTLTSMFALTPDTLAACASAAICFMCSMVTISASSVSLEGRSIQLIQSLPAATGEVLRAKLRLHLSITLPATVLAQAVLLILIRPGILGALTLILTPWTFACLAAFAGLAVNLKFPKLDWINEVAAIKQSMSTFVAMMGAMAFCGLLILPYLLLGSVLSAAVYMLFCALLCAILALVLRRWIMTRGCVIFASL
ncbi:MAG: hypothetical protein WCQ72_02875 [Eubacteriales bacterium]